MCKTYHYQLYIYYRFIHDCTSLVNNAEDDDEGEFIRLIFNNIFLCL